ncbi:hypothetical protein Dip518_001012 [Parelusimicrobium proximum]|uniref:DUF2147 domain-containing protein n=1 Tax=Parelusimicrobium proximum TaxID=3228953 RepID=UPI003D17BB0A
MKKTLIVTAVLLISQALCFAAEPAKAQEIKTAEQQSAVGFWQTIDDETKLPKSVTAVYEHDGQIYGRVIMIYDTDGKTVKDTIYTAKVKADKVDGQPPYCGLDIIWGMTKKSEGKYAGGKILNPATGKIYTSIMTLKANGDLIVRGKIGPIGKNQTWKPFAKADFPAGFKVPDLKTINPDIAIAK